MKEIYKKTEIMDTYTIKTAYHWVNDLEIEIKSENLIYVESGTTHSGCQCKNMDNHDVIHDKCRKIADLIREIEKLNI